MCPMRFVLVFFSLLIAGYFALKALWTADDADASDKRKSKHEDVASVEDAGECRGFFSKHFSRIPSGFWTLVDMASGRYIWKALRGPKDVGDVKVSSNKYCSGENVSDKGHMNELMMVAPTPTVKQI